MLKYKTKILIKLFVLNCVFVCCLYGNTVMEARLLKYNKFTSLYLHLLVISLIMTFVSFFFYLQARSYYSQYNCHLCDLR